MLHTLVVADDLSGAADCAIAFAGQGSAAVALKDGEIEAGILAIDADTRRGDAAMAHDATARIFARHAATPLLYKKFDSTLRGHVGVEIAAALSGLGGRDPLAIVTPAFPATGRVLRGGRVFVNGVPLEETQMGREIRGNVDLSRMLADAGLRIFPVDLAALRGGNKLAIPPGTNALVCDAETESDLAAIVAAGRALDRTILWAGSGGLARHLGEAGGTMPDLPFVAGDILFLIGSRSQASRLQAQTLATQSGASLVRFAPQDMDVLPPRVGGDMAILLEGDTHADPDALIRSFAAAVAPAAAHAGALFLTGGDTARAVLQALGVAALRLIGECEPGVILSRAQGGAVDGQIIITKAGGFGTPDTMQRCRDILREAR